MYTPTSLPRTPESWLFLTHAFVASKTPRTATSIPDRAAFPWCGVTTPSSDWSLCAPSLWTRVAAGWQTHLSRPAAWSSCLWRMLRIRHRHAVRSFVSRWLACSVRLHTTEAAPPTCPSTTYKKTPPPCTHMYLPKDLPSFEKDNKIIRYV